MFLIFFAHLSNAFRVIFWIVLLSRVRAKILHLRLHLPSCLLQLPLLLLPLLSSFCLFYPLLPLLVLLLLRLPSCFFALPAAAGSASWTSCLKVSVSCFKSTFGFRLQYLFNSFIASCPSEGSLWSRFIEQGLLLCFCWNHKSRHYNICGRFPCVSCRLLLRLGSSSSAYCPSECSPTASKLLLGSVYHLLLKSVLYIVSAKPAFVREATDPSIHLLQFASLSV